MLTSIIVHERIADWYPRLRPRLAGEAAVRWVESRSTGDLTRAVLGGDGGRIVLLNLAGRTYWGMEGLETLSGVEHDALILVLDPDRVPEVPTLAREFGATLVWSGVVVPPRVETLLRRWLPLAAARSRAPIIAPDA